MISKDIESSWVEHYLNISPIPWLYRFEYLEYLFIVIPGSFAGEILKNGSQRTMRISIRQKSEQELLY